MASKHRRVRLLGRMKNRRLERKLANDRAYWGTPIACFRCGADVCHLCGACPEAVCYPYAVNGWGDPVSPPV